MHRDEVAPGPDLLQRQLLHAEGGRGFGGDDGVVAYGLMQSGRSVLPPGTMLVAGPGGAVLPIAPPCPGSLPSCQKPAYG